MKSVFKTMQEALQESTFNFFVVTSTEILGHELLAAAKEDCDRANKALAAGGIPETIALVVDRKLGKKY